MGDDPARGVESHTTMMVCVKAFSPGFYYGYMFRLCYMLFFRVKAPTPVRFKGADLISCLFSLCAYQKKKKNSYATGCQQRKENDEKNGEVIR